MGKWTDKITGAKGKSPVAEAFNQTAGWGLTAASAYGAVTTVPDLVEQFLTNRAVSAVLDDATVTIGTATSSLQDLLGDQTEAVGRAYADYLAEIDFSAAAAAVDPTPFEGFLTSLQENNAALHEKVSSLLADATSIDIPVINELGNVVQERGETVTQSLSDYIEELGLEDSWPVLAASAAAVLVGAVAGRLLANGLGLREGHTEQLEQTVATSQIQVGQAIQALAQQNQQLAAGVQNGFKQLGTALDQEFSTIHTQISDLQTAAPSAEQTGALGIKDDGAGHAADPYDRLTSDSAPDLARKDLDFLEQQADRLMAGRSSGVAQDMTPPDDFDMLEQRQENLAAGGAVAEEQKALLQKYINGSRDQAQMSNLNR